MVNRLRPGAAAFVEQKDIGHGNYRFETIEAAYADETGKPAWEGTAEIIVEWLKDVRGH